MANRAKRTPEKDEQFFDAIVDAGGNITEACKATSYSRRSVYEYRASDPEFASRFDEATERGLDALEDECRRRAFLGTDRPVFYQGAQCGAIREYSDTLAIFLLKGGKPDKYRERYGHELAGPGGVPIGVGAVLILPPNGRDIDASADPGP